MEVGKKGNKPKNGGKSSSHFDDCSCETYECYLVNSYQLISSSSFIINTYKSIYFVLKFEFLDIDILVVDNVR